MYSLGKYVLCTWFKLHSQQHFVESQFTSHHACLLPKKVIFIQMYRKTFQMQNKKRGF